MTHRERILAALECKSVDVTPFDLGGTKCTSINPHADRNLRKLLGLERPEKWGSYRFQRVHMDEELADFFDVDVRRVGEDFPDPLTPEITAPVQTDEFGVEWIQSGNGLFSPSVSSTPLGSITSISDILNYDWPDPGDWQPADILADKAKNYRLSTDCAVCLDLPDCVVQYSQYLRGTEQWMIDLLTDKKIALALMEKISEIYCEMVTQVLSQAGQWVDCVIIPDDMGGQNGLLMSPETYREMIKPFHRRIIETVKRFNNVKIIFHSCGSNFPLIGDYIDMGVDALNPVQVSANGMETDKLYSEYGGKICFWGAVDTQSVLPEGSPDDVKAEVKKRIDDLGGGGYVAAAVHVIQAEVPPENILAMAESAHYYGGRENSEKFRIENAKGFFSCN